jgi:peroxiredoxin
VELYALQNVMKDINELGANMVAISPQNAALNAEVQKKHRLTFPVLTDQDNAYAKSLELVYALSDELAELYKSFGIDLPGNHGTDTWEVPLATRIVVGKDGIVAAVDADPDYTIRPEPTATLEVLRSLL